MPAPDLLPAPIFTWAFDSDGEATPHAGIAYVRRHPLPNSPASLFVHAVLTSEEDSALAPDVTPDQIANWFNVSKEWRTDEGIRLVEWSYVMKGCERAEVYERFVELERELVQISVIVDGEIDEATLADWLARFFDAPLGLPMLDARRTLASERSPR